MPVSINGTNGLIDANITGTVTGNLQGNVTGNVTGDVTGNLTGTASNASAVTDGSIVAEDLNGGQTGLAPIYGCRAWATFAGNIVTDITGTWSRTATNVSITLASPHNFIPLNRVYFTFTSGTTPPTNATYTITEIVNSNTFIIDATPGTAASGNVTLQLRQIQAAGNVNYVSRLNTAGRYVVNFSTPMPITDYALVGIGMDVLTDGANRLFLQTRTQLIGSAVVNTIGDGGFELDALRAQIAVFC